MTPDEIQALGDAVAESLTKKLRPQARAFAEASKSTADTIAVLAGKMDVREQESATKKADMIRAVERFGGTVEGLSGRIDTALRVLGHEPEPEPEPPAKPRTTAAADELQAEALTTGTRFLRWFSTRPDALAAEVSAGVAYATKNPKKTVLIVLGIIGALRVLAPHIPGVGVIADVLQALVSAVSPTTPLEAP